MLVATPGQTTSYPLHNSGSGVVGSGANKNKTTTTTTCHVSSSATPKANSNNNNLNNALHKSATVSTSAATRHIVNNKLSSSDASNTTANNTSNAAAAATNSTAATALMKTLSVRLNRGTEFLKGTVQKVLISATATAAASTTTTTVTSNSTASANTTTARAATAASSSTTTSSSSTSRLIVPSPSFLKLYTVPPTITHHYPEERVQAGSVDSLIKEMCHFKPIRSAPTTPWKCGTKSRGGASLKHPKACLATKYNTDCDDPTIKDDGRQYIVGEAPKASSTLLTTIISTPSHQSAFVCLVAQMKNLVINQAKQQSSSLSSSPSSPSSASNKTLNLLNKTTTKNVRGRVARRQRNFKMRESPLNVPLTQLLLRQRKSSFVQVKKLHVPAELIINSSKSGRNKRSAMYTAKPTPLHISPISSGSKAKLKKNAKTKQFINIAALAHENNQAAGVGDGDSTAGRAQRNLRKRRISCDFTAEINERILRKSARLSKDCSSEVMKITTLKNVKSSGAGVGSGNTGKRQGRLISKRNHNSFSPPLTRSRLKQLMLQKQFDSATTAAAKVTTLDHRQQQQVA